MTFRAGVSIYSIPERALDILQNFVVKHDFEAMEIWSTLLPEDSLSQFLSDHELGLSVHGPLLDLGSVEQRTTNIESVRETIELAHFHAATTVVLHTGVMDDAISREESLETAASVIRANQDLLVEHDIHLCIENVGYLGNDLISDASQLASFIDSLSHPLISVVLDLAHANVTGEVAEYLDVLSPRITHLHVSDNTGEVEGHHMALGMGMIDFGLLRGGSIPDRATIILEVEPRSDWYENLLKSRRLLQELMLV